ncbi:MAG: DUF2470 domain-containing protein [Microcystaceae cyanobacterium]
MSDPITPTISDRICKHMNEDHADAIVFYAKAYGNSPEAEAAQMLSIDPEGMNLLVQMNGKTVPIRVEFDHVLKDAEDAHYTLIDMVKAAKRIQN